MAVSIRKSGKDIIVKLSGIFNYTLHAEFRHSYESHQDDKSYKFTLDFSDVSFIDSSSLGMLLLMHDFVGADFHNIDNSKIKLIHCNDKIKSIMEIANFHVFFDIS
ncbi:MAG: STAS domain-containing protein [Methylococcaceae bacterium]|nr:STAS domain-containing protein [Methylococcaceae bacterium]